MTTHPPGQLDDQGLVPIDVQRLVETRMLVQANSGAGKSYTLRRILEQTYGKVQHLVIDVEGEFHSLRTAFDYVLAAPTGGDCVANVGTAALLARRLLELGASAIVDIYELGAQQPRFVQLFLEGLMSAPRDLWRPVLVVVDEAHKFAPEKSDAVSAYAVIDLMTRGRKRGFAGVLATQRLSKLDKDAAAEANNLVIGRTALDLDIARAAAVLGMNMKDARATLPKLEPGQFYVVGPALSPTVELIQIGGVKTSHPKAGARGTAPTPPREHVRKILAKLADLPAEAEQEATTVADLRAKIRELVDERDQLSRSINAPRPEDEGSFAAQAALDRLTDERDRLREALDEAERLNELHEDIEETICRDIDDAIGRLTEIRNTVVNRIERFVAETPAPTPAAEVPRTNGTPRPAPGGMPAMHRAFLTALAQYSRLTKPKILVYTGYSRGGATSKCFADLIKNGWAYTTDDGLLQITDAGMRALGPFEPLPRGRELRVKIAHELAGMEQSMFQAICAVYPQSITKHDVLAQTGYSRGGATSKAFAYLVARDYAVQDGPGRLRAAKELFE